MLDVIFVNRINLNVITVGLELIIEEQTFSNYYFIFPEAESKSQIFVFLNRVEIVFGNKYVTWISLTSNGEVDVILFLFLTSYNDETIFDL